jgi:hypothetical protein
METERLEVDPENLRNIKPNISISSGIGEENEVNGNVHNRGHHRKWAISLFEG